MAGVTKLRWELADRPASPSATKRGGQSALFEESVFDREPGIGEYRGLEFLHVKAQRIINEVKGAPFGFSHTINAYRGCSHSCSYCAVGETPILMADGRTKLLADICPGDKVYGTVRRGSYRRYVPTEVLDHWSTGLKPAYRVVLEDGTELVTSGDHRFLTGRGWKHVVGDGNGPRCRPHLTTNNSLLGVGKFAEPPEEGDDVALKSDAQLRVTSVEPLGIDLPMYDIATGTGDFIANGVVSHNCFARPTHEYLELDADRDFESKIVVKVNAASLLERELRSPRWSGDMIAMGTNTDPYQRAEGKYRLTRGIIEVLTAQGNPFSLLTKSTLVLRDLGLLAEAAARDLVRVNFSIPTLDEDVWRATEPGTPHPQRRIRAVERLNQAGVPCGVLMAPVLPHISDRPEQLDKVVRACVEAGARSISAGLLHLRAGVKEVFLSRLGETHPELLQTYISQYRNRVYAPRSDQAVLNALIRDLVREHGGPMEDTEPSIRPTPVDPPTSRSAPSNRSDQLSLL